MKIIVYDKLIRDKIPKIIKKQDKELKIQEMDKKEHLNYWIKSLKRN